RNGPSTTVQPVAASASVAWPTRIPGTSVSPGISRSPEASPKGASPAPRAAADLVAEGEEQAPIGVGLGRRRLVALGVPLHADDPRELRGLDRLHDPVLGDRHDLELLSHV